MRGFVYENLTVLMKCGYLKGVLMTIVELILVSYNNVTNKENEISTKKNCIFFYYEESQSFSKIN